MDCLIILGRQPEISIAELKAQFPKATFSTNYKNDHSSKYCFAKIPEFSQLLPRFNLERFGGIIKFAIKLEQKPLEFLQSLPEGKITIGVSDYSKKASKKTAQNEALKFKKILVRYGRSVRVVENKEAILSTATSLHNGLSGKNERKIELIKSDNEWYRVVWIQDIDSYAKRDQKRPARDAKVGMLPPKLAQILINLCGPLPKNSTILDPFCGTGVLLQEALLMGYKAYGTDINERMIKYSEKNLSWLEKSHFNPDKSSLESQTSHNYKANYRVQQGDATSFEWQQPIDAVACESYLGKPMSKIPTEIELKKQKHECKTIILGFLKNLKTQIKPNTSITVAVPAWLRPNNFYERLDIIDEIEDMGYNVENKSREGLFYCRENQIVARDILILRNK